MKIGALELLVIFFVAFFVLGPEKTVQAMRKLGKFLRTLKVYISSMTGELRETIEEPIRQIQEPLQEMAAPFNEITNAVQAPVNELNKMIAGLGKESPVPHSAKDEPVAAAPKDLKEDPDPEPLEFAEPVTEEADGS